MGTLRGTLLRLRDQGTGSQASKHANQESLIEVKLGKLPLEPMLACAGELTVPKVTGRCFEEDAARTVNNLRFQPDKAATESEKSIVGGMRGCNSRPLPPPPFSFEL